MHKKTPRKPDQRMKRIMDLAICILGLPIILPVAALVAACVFFDGYAAPIYRQKRIGKDGKLFTMYKFRTMVKNADSLLEDYLRANPEYAEEWRENQKLRNDPRVTRFGEFLRKSSLDELPQFYNILRGDMSLVGPRPIVADESRKYGIYFGEYCELRPGLTGLWQISGRSDTTYAERVAYDHFYFNNWRARLDIYILAKTIPAVIRRDGSY